MTAVLVHESESATAKAIIAAFTEATRQTSVVYDTYIVRTLEEALNALLVGPICAYDLLISEEDVLVEKLLDDRSGRFDSLLMVQNTGEIRSDGMPRLEQTIKKTLAVGGLPF